MLVRFTWTDGKSYLGLVQEITHFKGNVRYGVQVNHPTTTDPHGIPGGRTYDVWDHLNDIRPL